MGLAAQWQKPAPWAARAVAAEHPGPHSGGFGVGSQANIGVGPPFPSGPHLQPPVPICPGAGETESHGLSGRGLRGLEVDFAHLTCCSLDFEAGRCRSLLQVV